MRMVLLFIFLISNQVFAQGTYAEAGVNIDAGDQLVERIKPLAKMTARLGSDASLGGFGGLFDLAQCGYKDPILVGTTDGVGTKLKIAQALKKHETIGIDLVAMSLNDLIVQGAEPLFFLDYFATGSLKVEEAYEVIGGIAKACQENGCALLGGETAEMPGMYSQGEYDLAGFAVGVVERSQVLPRLADIRSGDVVLGLASSGVHSNGFSLIRHSMALKGLSLMDPSFSDKTIGEVLLVPTKIYVRSLLPLIKDGCIKAMAHITGGGLLENIPRVLPEKLGVKLDARKWEVPPVFSWIARMGNIESKEMMRTFNLGIGMVLIVSEQEAAEIQAKLEQAGERVWLIGKIIPTADSSCVIIEGLDI